MVTVYEVDPGGKLSKAISDASKKLKDLTIPFLEITNSWYKGNQAIFMGNGPKKWPDYKVDKNLGYSPYAKKKQAEFGSAYPMLVRYGILMESMTNPSDHDAINKILNKNTLILGTSVPYGVYHQSSAARKKIPFRPFMFLGGEQQAPDSLQTRRDNWIKMVEKFVLDKSSTVGSVK